MADHKKVVIIGGVAGGASAAARTRRLSEDAKIILFERGEYISFANCGLPYHVGKAIDERSKLLLMTPEKFKARTNIEVRTFQEITAINPCLNYHTNPFNTFWLSMYVCTDSFIRTF